MTLYMGCCRTLYGDVLFSLHYFLVIRTDRGTLLPAKGIPGIPSFPSIQPGGLERREGTDGTGRGKRGGKLASVEEGRKNPRREGK